MDIFNEPQKTIEAFISGAKSQGIAPDRLFTYNDLVTKNISPIIKCLIFVKKFYEAKQRKNLNDTTIKQFMTPNKPKTSLCIGGITWSASSRVFNINY